MKPVKVGTTSQPQKPSPVGGTPTGLVTWSTAETVGCSLVQVLGWWAADEAREKEKKFAESQLKLDESKVKVAEAQMVLAREQQARKAEAAAKREKSAYALNAIRDPQFTRSLSPRSAARLGDEANQGIHELKEVP